MPAAHRESARRFRYGRAEMQIHFALAEPARWEGDVRLNGSDVVAIPGKEGRTVPVHLHSKVTEVGTLELWCISRDGKQRWKLEFNVRDKQ